jgi:hypothetical protein
VLAFASLATLFALTACSDNSGVSAGGAGIDTAVQQRAPALSDAGAAERRAAAHKAEPPARRSRANLRLRSIIRTAELVVRTRDVTRAARRATQLVAGTDGYVASQQTSGQRDGSPASVHLVLRVPVDDFERIADQLTTYGKVQSDERNATDVTEEVVDVESRIATQKRSIARLRTLLGKAKTVGEVVQVESELAAREADLESLQSRYAVLTSQTTLSTIDVTFVAQPADDHDDSGFFAGLRSGWRAFVAFIQFLLTAVGAAIPFAVTLAVLGVPVWLAVRTRRRKAHSREAPARPEPTAEPPPAPTS